MPGLHPVVEGLGSASSLAAGAAVVTVPRFEPASVLDLIERHRVSRWTAVPPPVAAFLAHHPGVAGRNLSSLELLAVGGAPLPVAVQRAVVAALCGSACRPGLAFDGDDCRAFRPEGTLFDPGPPGTVGRLLPNTELMVVDPDSGRACGPGEAGELWLSGPQVMGGGLNLPSATAETVNPDGWLRAGDLGHLDRAGNVIIVDRLKEIIKVDGYQVPPAELEACSSPIRRSPMPR